MIINKKLFFILLILSGFNTSQNLFSQNDVVHMDSVDIKMALKNVDFSFGEYKLSKPTIDDPQNFNIENSQKQYLLTKFSQYHQIKFEQHLSLNDFGFGGYKHFSNNWFYQYSDKLSFNVQAGLVVQNSLLNYNSPILNYSISSEAEFNLFNNVSIYFKGQYISNPLNKNRNYYDPFIFMNPLYLQSEVGTGIKAEFNNIKADVGVKTMYDTQHKKNMPVNSMNTKVSIGF